MESGLKMTDYVELMSLSLSSAELSKKTKGKKGKNEALPHDLSSSGQVGPQVAFFRHYKGFDTMKKMSAPLGVSKLSFHVPKHFCESETQYATFGHYLLL